MFKIQTPSLINVVHWPSSRHWTWKKATKFGWRLFTSHQGRIWLTTVNTTIISRVSCWRRRHLWSHFDDFVSIIRKIIFNYNRKKYLGYFIKFNIFLKIKTFKFYCVFLRSVDIHSSIFIKKIPTPWLLLIRLYFIPFPHIFLFYEIHFFLL